MNDPHVVALLYRVEHSKSVDYNEAVPLVHEESNFRLEVKDNKASFKFKIHYATREDARNAVEGYIHDWECEACLKMGPDNFRLIFEKAEIIDRKPTPGVINLHMSAVAGSPRASFTLTVVAASYPTPPAGVNYYHPDVQTMYQRYLGYRRGNEPLASMSYFCLTVLEVSTGQKKSQLKSAAQKYQIANTVLNKIGDLCSNKGGPGARKADGVSNDFTTEERTFLEQAIKSIIRRCAEKAHAPNIPLRQITMSDLPLI